ncbi:MAG: triose-phosphate isomerase [Gemmatimonadales bacterium]|nr:triose-phosphate isomerase [Gemmatimonadales bacterium]MBA3690997.1 triose-phosphate isomerase [Actinomycetota bacterium]
MIPGVAITPPFFEVGPKTYAYGEAIVELARCADALSEAHGVQVILTPQYVDIPAVAAVVRHVLVFAQHMDPLHPGRGIGAVLPEALKAAGARGVLLNHVERRLPREELERTVRRADEVGLATMVCADDATEAVAIAALRPNVIIVEAPERIGASSADDAGRATIPETDAAIWQVDRRIRVVHAAGISTARDVYDVIAAGAQGTGSTSAIFTASDPQAMLASMITAVRDAWDGTHGNRAPTADDGRS